MLRGTTLTAALGVLLGPTGDASADCVDGRPINIGHRGTGDSTPENPLPENTIPSIAAAADEGSIMAEIDVQLSADGVPVLMHDLRVDTTTDGMGCVSELTVEELQQLDAGAGTPMEGMGIQVPTLEEVLAETTIDLNVELKTGGDGCATFDDAEYVSAVLDVLDTDPAGREFLMSSFDFPLVEEVRSQDAAIPVGQIALSFASAPAAAKAGFDALILTEASTDEAAVMLVREAGLDLYIWTVDDPDRMAELFALDVDGIITNEPPVLEMVRSEACPTEGEDSTDTGDPPMGSTGEPPMDSTGEPPAGTGDEGGSTGTSEVDPSLEDDDSGCGCRSNAPQGAGPWALLMLGLFVRRRTRRS